MKKNMSSYFLKIYAINSDREENDEKNKSLEKQRKIKERKKKINSLLKVFKHPKNNKKNGCIWPKVTRPKLPFSNDRKENPEIKKKKIELLKPSRLYHDFHTIQWLRKKYSDSIIEKSVFSILPQKENANTPIKEDEIKKRQRKMLEYLESFKEPLGKEKFVKINPKYLYNQTTFDKIKKLKEIFLEFDGGGHRKMEMNELINLFNQNHIRADIKELVNLFFKEKKVKKEDYMKLYLNFYQFLTFALTKEQDFRQFMRNIKEKYSKIDNEENKDKDTYLPMNLNLVLDYFINKGKERSSIEKIENAIIEMDNIIKENTLMVDRVSQKEFIYSDSTYSNLKIKKKEKKKHKNIKLQENTNISDSRRQSNRELTKSICHGYSTSDITDQKPFPSNNLKSPKKNEKEEIEKRFEKIDFKQLIQEFSNLFNYNGLNEIKNKERHNINKNKKSKKNNFSNKINSVYKSRRKSQEIKSVSFINFFSPLNKNNLNRITFINDKINNSNIAPFLELKEDENDIIGNAIRIQMKENSILNMNVKNYEKLHDIKLALNATKERFNQIQKNTNLNENFNIMKNTSSQSILPEINLLKNKNQKENNYKLNNMYIKSDISKHLNNSKSNSVKIFKKIDQTNNAIKTNINNYIIETNNNCSRYCKTNRTFLNIFCGKSQLIDMSQDHTDYTSKRKFDYVPPELLFTKKEN